MVRKLNKEKKTLAALEKDTEEQIKNLDRIRKSEFKDELNNRYFFCVVFDTNRERDEWLGKRSLKLVEDFFIRVEDFDKGHKR